MKILFFSFFLTFFLLLNVIFVCALGISTSPSELCFKPDLEKDIKFTVINTNDPPRTEISLSGDFAEYLTLEKDEIISLPGETSSIKGKLKFPGSMEGELEIIEVEFMPISPEVKNAISTKMKLKTLIKILRCWEGKHAFIENFQVYARTDLAEVRLIARNNGNEDIEDLLVKINILNSNKKLIHSFNITSSLEAYAELEQNTNFKVNLEPNEEYFAEGILIYDGIESNEKMQWEFIAKEIRSSSKSSASSQTQQTVTQKTYSKQIPSQEQNIQMVQQASQKTPFYYYGFQIAMAVAIAAIFFILGMFVGKHYFFMD